MRCLFLFVCTANIAGLVSRTTEGFKLPVALAIYRSPDQVKLIRPYVVQLNPTGHNFSVIRCIYGPNKRMPFPDESSVLVC